MSNRSHRNAGHIGINIFRKKGLQHSSELKLAASSFETTSHVITVSDCLELLRQVPDNSI